MQVTCAYEILLKSGFTPTTLVETMTSGRIAGKLGEHQDGWYVSSHRTAGLGKEKSCSIYPMPNTSTNTAYELFSTMDARA